MPSSSKLQIEIVTRTTQTPITERSEAVPERKPRRRSTTAVRRPTLVDVAQAAGVSLSAASYALNDKPGVSSTTRAEVLRVAAKLGWSPSHTARALQGQRTEVVGLVLAVDRGSVRGLGDYMMRFVNGVTAELATSGRAMLVTTATSEADELAVYRTWAQQRRVDAFVITNIRREDRRLRLVESLATPAIIAGDVRGRSTLPSVWTDDATAMQMTLDHLVEKGHRRIMRFSDNAHYVHAQIRAQEFRRYLRAHDLPAGRNRVAPATRKTAAERFRALLAEPDPPTAFLCDSADRACQTLLALQDLGYRVPDDIAVVAWDDAASCQITTPMITAVSRDSFDYGTVVARQLVEQLTDGVTADRQGVVSKLIIRGSS